MATKISLEEARALSLSLGYSGALSPARNMTKENGEFFIEEYDLYGHIQGDLLYLNKDEEHWYRVELIDEDEDEIIETVNFFKTMHGLILMEKGRDSMELPVGGILSMGKDRDIKVTALNGPAVIFAGLNNYYRCS